ncbi:hypothetical protein [Bacillus sp. 7894-2]|uniref:hypothetical protein n=1 Tax=Bacillus sp. 7894-2 TaxID=2021695 RepID=UPI000BA68AAC|nr:hypothetical protein [Bacillus sp. 7894-2]PAE24745.1 hypothetical protein CHI10_11500 [Bacillus sp. 7894-2]
MVRLATLYEKPLTKDRAKELAIAALTGNLGKSLFRQALKFIPGAGSLVGAGIAGSMTLALVYGIKYAYENNIELDAEVLKSLSKMFFKKRIIYILIYKIKMYLKSLGSQNLQAFCIL